MKNLKSLIRSIFRLITKRNAQSFGPTPVPNFVAGAITFPNIPKFTSLFINDAGMTLTSNEVRPTTGWKDTFIDSKTPSRSLTATAKLAEGQYVDPEIIGLMWNHQDINVDLIDGGNGEGTRYVLKDASVRQLTYNGEIEIHCSGAEIYGNVVNEEVDNEFVV